MVQLIGKLKEEKMVYYCVDKWSEFTFIDKQSMEEMERTVAESADVVFATAHNLFDAMKRYNPNTHLIRHGVDFDFFARALDPGTEEPEDIRDLPRPRIGFFGLIHNWIDLDLFEYIAKAHPEWSVLLIGKVAEDVTGRAAEVDKLANVHFLGRKPYESLAGYCKGFDVGTIPFEINAMTLNVNPIKLREYLAAGLPVVSTNLPEVAPYSEVVCLAEDAETFTRGVEEALRQSGPDWIKRRQKAVEGETWQARVEEISEWVESIGISHKR